jgi:transketolase
MNNTELAVLAEKLRLESLRMIAAAGSGHPGGSLSAAELLAVLYFRTARLNPAEPGWPERDRIFVSKGHCAPVYYAVLARAGFFPEAELATFRRMGSRLQGHPDRNKLPGVEMSSGPLGLGASAAVGCALGLRQTGSSARVFCLLGDGEIQEGVVWEAALCAAKYRLGKLCFILDYNHYQLSGRVDKVLPLEPLEDKWRSFGWQVRVIDGHDVAQISAALAESEDGTEDARPRMVIANTRKGRGVSFMEDDAGWHGRVPTAVELARAEEEISRRISGLEGKKR